MNPDRPRVRINGSGLVVAAALLLAWEGAVRTGAVSFDALPAPSAVVGAARDLMATGELPVAVVHTLRVTVTGWVAASVIGVGLGTPLGRNATVHRWSMTSFEAAKAVPPITLVPAALLLFGFSLWMELSLVVFAGVWPVLINTVGGIHQVPTELLDVARTAGLGRWSTIRLVVLPAALPEIIVGLRLSLSLCLVLAVIAEMLGNPAGIGNALILAQQGLRPADMFVYVTAAGLLGVALGGLLRLATGRLFPAATIS